MEIALSVLLSMVTAICFWGGANLIRKGVAIFLPKGAEAPPRLDNIFRFLSGIYLGMGFLMMWITIHSNQVGALLYFIGLVVFFSGLGRLYSRAKVGSPGKYYDAMMVLELMLGVSIAALNYFIAKGG